MSLYNIYGIGNALVDIEYETRDQELRELKIDKGRMTLAPTERQVEHMVHFGSRAKSRACGGSAANTVIGATQLGSKCFYSCHVANDDTGHFFIEDLIRNGVDTNLDKSRLPEGSTGTCLVFITPDAERSMNTHLGITEFLSKSAIQEKALKNSQYFYMEGYLVTSSTGRDAAIAARKIAEASGVKTALSFSDQNMVEYFRDGLKEMIGNRLDMIFCNRSEALLFCKTTDLDVAVAELKKVSRTFAITLGGDGSLVFDGTQIHRVKAFPVDPIDTNGAGDLFAGSFLAAITQGTSFPEAARLANFAASRLIGKYGPRLGTREVEVVKKFRQDGV